MLDAARTPWPDVAAHLDGGIAILPFGALEQHGPHLPLSVDTATAEAVARRLAEALDAVLLPAIPYGDTWNNAGYPGTVSLSTATVVGIASDIGRAVTGAGCRLFVVVNGDWGNRGPLYTAMRTLTAEGVTAIALDYPGMDGAIARVRESRPAAAGIDHAEEVETSIMLAIDPTSVHPDRYAAEYPRMPADFGLRPMQLHTLSRSGVFGDPSPATAEKGAAILDAIVEESLRVLRAVPGHPASAA